MSFLRRMSSIYPSHQSGTNRAILDFSRAGLGGGGSASPITYALEERLSVGSVVGHTSVGLDFIVMIWVMGGAKL